MSKTKDFYNSYEVIADYKINDKVFNLCFGSEKIFSHKTVEEKLVKINKYTLGKSRNSVYKCLVKISLTLLPFEEMIYDNYLIFYDTIKWLKKYPHEDYDVPLILISNLDFTIKFPLRAILLKRKSYDLKVPYLTFVLLFGHTFLQIFIPETPMNNNLIGQTVDVFPFPVFPENHNTPEFSYYQYFLKK